MAVRNRGSRADGSRRPAQGILTVDLPDKMQSWSAAVYPQNRTTSWRSLSQLTGAGPGNVVLTASGAGFEPGAYRNDRDSVSQYDATVCERRGDVRIGRRRWHFGQFDRQLSVASGRGGAPGMEMLIMGTHLANTAATGSGNPLPYSLAGVGVSVNGQPAPLTCVSSGQLNIQMPYTVGAGPAVLSVKNNGQIAGLQFQVAPSAPGIFADQNGNNLALYASAAQGGGDSVWNRLRSADTGAGDGLSAAGRFGCITCPAGFRNGWECTRVHQFRRTGD
jgi:hypothetical protein